MDGELKTYDIRQIYTGLYRSLTQEENDIETESERNYGPYDIFCIISRTKNKISP